MGSQSGDYQAEANAQIQAAKIAAQASTSNTELGINELQNMYNASQQSINNYYTQGQNQLAPYSVAGGTALDAYMQTLGLPTVSGGSNQLEAALQANTAEQNYNAVGVNNANAATSTAALQSSIDAGNAAVGSTSQPLGPLNLQAYQGPQPTITPQQQSEAQAYQAGNLPMTASSPTAGLQAFANTGTAQILGYNPNMSMTQNFQNNDPGYQFALQQGTTAVNQAASVGGYLNNPNTQAYLQTFGQGLADQQFGAYQASIQNAFGGYQNQLAGLAGLGQQAATTNSAAANSASSLSQNSTSNTASGINSAYGSIGTAQSNSALAQGNALASMYQNEANQSAANSQSMFGALGSVGGALIGLL